MTNFYNYEKRLLRQNVLDKLSSERKSTILVQRKNATSGITDYVFFFFSDSANEHDSSTKASTPSNCKCFVTRMDPFPLDKYCASGEQLNSTTSLYNGKLNVTLYEMHSFSNVTHITTQNSLWMHKFEKLNDKQCWPVTWQVMEKYQKGETIAVNRAAITIYNVSQEIEDEKQVFQVPSACPPIETC